MEKKEYAVGEEFQFGLKRLRCEESMGCKACVFYRIDDCRQQLGRFIGECEPMLRDDEKNVIFVEVK